MVLRGGSCVTEWECAKEGAVRCQCSERRSGDGVEEVETLFVLLVVEFGFSCCSLEFCECDILSVGRESELAL